MSWSRLRVNKLLQTLLLNFTVQFALICAQKGRFILCASTKAETKYRTVWQDGNAAKGKRQARARLISFLTSCLVYQRRVSERQSGSDCCCRAVVSHFCGTAGHQKASEGDNRLERARAGRGMSSGDGICWIISSLVGVLTSGWTRADLHTCVWKSKCVWPPYNCSSDVSRVSLLHMPIKCVFKITLGAPEIWESTNSVLSFSTNVFHISLLNSHKYQQASLYRITKQRLDKRTTSTATIKTICRHCPQMTFYWSDMCLLVNQMMTATTKVVTDDVHVALISYAIKTGHKSSIYEDHNVQFLLERGVDLF